MLYGFEEIEEYFSDLPDISRDGAIISWMRWKYGKDASYEVEDVMCFWDNKNSTNTTEQA